MYDKTSNHYTIGSWTVPWIVVFGSSTSFYMPNAVQLFLEEGRLEVTEPVLKKNIETITKEQKKLEAIGRNEFHDGPTLGLWEISEVEVGESERPILRIRLKKTNYFNFIAIVSNLDKEFLDVTGKTTTLRKKYINGDYSVPVPQLAPVFAIQMTVVTNDGYFMITRRASKGVIGYRNHLAPAVNESLHASKDYFDGKLSIVATVLRAAEEELNLVIEENNFKFFTLGVDENEYMYTLTGIISLDNYTANELNTHLARGTKGGKENANRYFLGPDVLTCARQMSDLSAEYKWAPYGVVCLTQAMMHIFGQAEVDSALKIYGRKY